jgi:tetratricopeptide (TPR) repeat protein
LFVLTAVVFMRVIGCDFLNHDDPDYVADNPHVRSGLSVDNAVWAATSLNGGVSYWHPLTWLSHQADCALFGLNPAAHHLTNLWWHVANTLMVLALMRRLGWKGPAGFLGAAVFGVHPLHVESVAWIAERKDVLYGFWWLAAAYGYVRFRQEGQQRWYWGALGCFAMGLLSKPTAVTLPIVLVLLEWTAERCADLRFSRDSIAQASGAMSQWWNLASRSVRLLWPFMLLAAGSGLVTLAGQHALGALPSLAALPLSDRSDNALVSYGIYLEKVFWPSGLCVSYVCSRPYSPGAVLTAAGILVAISCLTYWGSRSQPWLLAGWLWFVLTLAPNIGLVQAGAQSWADRYMYLPLIGVLLMIPAVGEMIAKRIRPQALCCLATVAVLCLSLVSIRQVTFWRNSTTLFTRAVEIDRQNWMAQLGLGMALTQERRFDEARPHLELALALSGHASEVQKRLDVYYRLRGLVSWHDTTGQPAPALARGHPSDHVH